MNRKNTLILSASCLIVAAGLAIAQPQNTPARQSVQTAERLTQMQGSLVDAIMAAEQHSNGTAIGARLSMNWTAFQQESLGHGQMDRQPVSQADRERIEREIREQNPNLSREQVSTQARERMERERRDRISDHPNYQDDRQNRERIEREIRERNPNLSPEQVSTQARERLERESRERAGNLPNPQADRENLERIEREIRERNPNLSREQVSTQARERLERENRERAATPEREEPIRGVSDGMNINAPLDRSPAIASRQQSPEFIDSQGDELFAVITCVIDQARVREIIVDMRDNSIVGVYAMDALRNGNDFTSDDSSRYEREATQTRSAANVRASDLMNATARTADGKRIGDIDELAIDPDSNRVVYAVLRRGGFLGMGESRFAIPTSELSIPHDGRMHTSLTETDFEGESGFENNNWPTRADQQWARTERADGTPAPAARRIVKATNIIGSSVECRDGNELGKIKDLIVEPRSGRVVYAIVNSSSGYLPVPMEVLRAKGDRGGYSMPMTMTELRDRPTIQANRDPNWNDTAWNRSIYESYGLTIDERYPQSDQNRDRRDDDRRDNDRGNNGR